MNEQMEKLQARIDKAVADYKITGEVASTFQRLPAYRYIRKSDHLPKKVPYGLKGSEIVCKVKICSYNPDTDIAYGVTDLGYGKEVGDFYMHEVVDVRIPHFGLPLEREQGYEPQSLRQVMGWTHEEEDPSEELINQAAVEARDKYLAEETSKLRKIEAKRAARAEERRQLREAEQRQEEAETRRLEDETRAASAQGRER